MDRVSQLAERAAQGLPLFDGGASAPDVCEARYWTAPNGYRHLIETTGTDGASVIRLPPYLDPARQKKCAQKRAWWARHKWRIASKERARKRRQRANYQRR